MNKNKGERRMIRVLIGGVLYIIHSGLAIIYSITFILLRYTK